MTNHTLDEADEGVTNRRRIYLEYNVAKDVIPAELYSKLDRIMELTPKAFLMHSDMPRTLVHNDPHLKNWYIKDGSVMGLGD